MLSGKRSGVLLSLGFVLSSTGCNPSWVPDTDAVAEQKLAARPQAQIVAEREPQVAIVVEEGTKPFDFDRSSSAGIVSGERCAFPTLAASDKYKVFAAGAYAGRKLGYQIDQSGNEATQVDVAVNQTDSPVVLMLGNYDPTVWNIGWSKGTRILAVLVSGYHRQTITGLSADVPVIVSTYDNKGACGYFYVTAESAAKLNPVARRVFGRSVDMVFPAKDGRVVIGSGLDDGTVLVTDQATKLAESFRIAESDAAGEAGLAYAVKQGWLRTATQPDAEAWQAAVSARPDADMPPIAGGRPAVRASLYNSYVVLGAFELPNGLYGAHSATFYIPKGVPKPTGNPGHSTFYDHNTLACSGPACGRE